MDDITRNAVQSMSQVKLAVAVGADLLSRIADPHSARTDRSALRGLCVTPSGPGAGNLWVRLRNFTAFSLHKADLGVLIDPSAFGVLSARCREWVCQKGAPNLSLNSPSNNCTHLFTNKPKGQLVKFPFRAVI